MYEQRQLPRWKVNKQVNVWIEEDDAISNCVLEDLNLKGMCMALPQRLPQEKTVKMGLGLSDSSFIEVQVQIPWVKKMVGYYQHGFYFKHILDEDKDKIFQYISQHCLKQMKAQWWHDA